MEDEGTILDKKDDPPGITEDPVDAVVADWAPEVKGILVDMGSMTEVVDDACSSARWTEAKLTVDEEAGIPKPT